MASPELVEAVAEVKSAADALAKTLKKGLLKPPYLSIDLVEAEPQLEKLLAAVAQVKEIVGEVAPATPSGRLEDLADMWFESHAPMDEADHRLAGPIPSRNDGGSY